MNNVSENNQIDLRIEDKVLYLTLNRPESRNALSAELIEQLLLVLAACNQTETSVQHEDGHSEQVALESHECKALELDLPGRENLTNSRQVPDSQVSDSQVPDRQVPNSQVPNRQFDHLQGCVNGSQVEQLASVRAIVLRGAGGNFCAGGDIKDMSNLVERGLKNDLDYIANYNALAGKLFAAISQAQPAVIAVLEGAVMGGGMGLAAACDLVVALKSSKFALPETGLGLVPAQVAPYLRARLGLSNARMLAVLGGQLDAGEARRIGLVHYLVENEDELLSTLQDILKKIRACAPRALATAKSLFVAERAAASEKPEDLGMIFARSLVSAEAREGMAAFKEKRRPSWNQ